ncbi:phage major tail tube protein [Enterobacter hormaechei]|uniref:phage major tail tube protein n=1 Tax=Enterobacter hormaechei TaxID=158836 RepID=UPI002A763A7A|nr:phage major tail tube protein [Enterobacter hormaechei]MDY3572313.1 phage major tail tube protein [Enterobacter hormaechei]
MSIYRGCSLFMNGFELSDTVTYTPPEIAIERVWFKTGAMNAPVGIDRGTRPMTATYKLIGHSFSSFLFFGFIPGIKTRLTVRRAFQGDRGVDYLEEEVEGYIDTIRADESGADSKSDVGYSMTVTVNYYRISLDGAPLLEINPILGLRKIMGVNVLSISDDVLSLFL